MTINNVNNFTIDDDSESYNWPVRNARRKVQLNTSRIVWKHTWAYEWPDKQDEKWIYGWPTYEHNYQQSDAEEDYEEDKWTTGLASRRNSVSSDSSTEENGRLPDHIVYNSVSTTPEHTFLIASRNNLVAMFQ